MSAQALADRLASRLGAPVARSRQGNNVYRLESPLSGLVTIHVSTGSRGWWGLAENVLLRLNASGKRWAAVFLENDMDHGFVLPADFLMEGITGGRWAAQEKSGKHFKFQTQRDLAGSYRFDSFDRLTGILQVLLDGAEDAN